MIDQTTASGKALREKLTDIIDNLPAETVTLSVVLDLIGREGLLLFCVFLTLPFMVPISLPGVSTVFGTMILLIGLSVMLNRNLWLPERLMKRAFPADRLRVALEKGTIWLQRLERISHPRLIGLTRGMAMSRFNGFMLAGGALLLMAPFGLIPLSNTLPGLAILFLALGILQSDGGFVIIGYVANVITIIYFALLLTGGGLAVREAIAGVLRLIS